ncbi:unnamed protein product [Cochlearia groenlandica]
MCSYFQYRYNQQLNQVLEFTALARAEDEERRAHPGYDFLSFLLHTKPSPLMADRPAPPSQSQHRSRAISQTAPGLTRRDVSATNPSFCKFSYDQAPFYFFYTVFTNTCERNTLY